MKPQKFLLLVIISLCPSGLFAGATLTISGFAQQFGNLYGMGAQAPQPCQVVFELSNPSLGCEEGDSNGGHFVASFRGGVPGPNTVGTIAAATTLIGKATVAIFPMRTPGMTSFASAGYSAYVVIGPQIAGDSFSFLLQQTDICQNNLTTKCHLRKAQVIGATSTKGKLENGQKITASQPVIILMDQMVTVGDPILANQQAGGGVPFAEDPVTNWSATLMSTITITPLKEVAQPALLNSDDE